VTLGDVPIGATLDSLRRWIVAAPGRTPVPVVRWDVGRDPGVVVARAGRPIRIAFRREGANPASAEVCFPDFGILAMVSPRGDTIVDVGRRAPGRYRFYAPDGDLEGWLVVEP